MTDDEKRTHIAYAMKREGRRLGRYLEVGYARQDADGTIHQFLDRTPIGGFNGYVLMVPIGAQPPSVAPARPDQVADEDI
jgi:hypothetical protein